MAENTEEALGSKGVAQRHGPITGHVAKILNSRELVLNRGAEDGVQAGMDFAVLDPEAESIRDPETGEDLGAVARPKVDVRVFVVQDRLSVARTFKSRRVNVGGYGLGGLSPSLQPPRYVRRYETLETDESTWDDLDESQRYVKTGDPVRQVLDIEEPPPPDEEMLALEEARKAEAETADGGD